MARSAFLESYMQTSDQVRNKSSKTILSSYAIIFFKNYVLFISDKGFNFVVIKINGK